MEIRKCPRHNVAVDRNQSSVHEYVPEPAPSADVASGSDPATMADVNAGTSADPVLSDRAAYTALTVASVFGLSIGFGSLLFADTAAWKLARVIVMLGLVVFAADFTLSKTSEKRFIERLAGPAGVAAAWVVFAQAVAEASGLDGGQE